MLAGIEWDQGHYCFVERVETGRRGLTGPGLGGTGQIWWTEEMLMTGTGRAEEKMMTGNGWAEEKMLTGTGWVEGMLLTGTAWAEGNAWAEEVLLTGIGRAVEKMLTGTVWTGEMIGLAETGFAWEEIGLAGIGTDSG